MAQVFQNLDGEQPEQDWFAQNGISTGPATPTNRGTTGTDNTGVNGPKPENNTADVASQFRDALMRAYPNKSKNTSWLEDQVSYFVAKSKSGERMGNGQVAPLSYWLDRASGMGAGGNDVAEAGPYAGGQSGNSGVIGGSFSPTDAPQFDLSSVPAYERFNAPNGPAIPTLGNYQSANPNQISAPGQPVVDRITGQVVNAATATTPQAQAADPISAERISGQQIGAPERIQGPQALNATLLQNPDKFQGVSEADLKADPSYQFRLNQGLGAIQNNKVAQGLGRTGGTLKALSDYAGESASQEYANVYNRKLGEFNNAFAQGAQANQQNNANTAQAYGLTNQYQQAAALANASNALNADQFNASQRQQANLANQSANLNAGQFNSSQQQQVNLANAGYGLSNNQFNAGNQQQASLTNAQLAQQAQSANAGNQLGAYSAYAPLAQNAQAQNAANSLTATQANNSAAMNYAQYGLGANNQAFNQSLAGYGANLGAQNQMFNQALGAYGANTNAALGYGNLGLGYGNLGLGWANYGLGEQNQYWNQNNTVDNQNWNRNWQVTQAGNPQGNG